jgi:hypothetical protein
MKNKPIKIKDITIPENYSMEKDGYTQTILSRYLSCRRACLLTLNGYRMPKDPSNIAFGDVGHKFLEMYYRQKMRRNKDFAHNVDSIVEKYYQKHLQKTNKPNEMEVDLIKLSVLLNNYLDFYKKDFDSKIGFTPVRVEKVFRSGKLRGKVDLILKMNHDNSFWVMDHKFNARIDRDYLESHLILDHQMKFYIIALEKLYNIKISGMIHNIIRRPSDSPYKRKQESITDFEKRFTDKVSKDPAYYFTRFTCPVSDSKKKEFRDDMFMKEEDYKNFLMIAKHYPEYAYPNEYACRMPYNCRYLNACSVGHLSGYEIKSPFQELEEEED